MANAVSLYELQEHLQRAVALNFPAPWWVRAEIAHLSEFRGHRFLELIQKEVEGEELLARADAVLWQDRFRLLEKRLGEDLLALLQAGMEVLLEVDVVHHPRFGLRLHIRDVDPAFTLGELERSRRAALASLRRQGMLERNRRLPLPLVPQHLAVLSSPAAAGWKDFVHQLQEDPANYRFQIELFPTAVQGDRAMPDMLRQLKQIRSQKNKFDALLLIRGGGSRLDLAAFDQPELARALAIFPLPVITGIGHEIDRSLADEVAHTSLKTPTAVADFLLNRARRLEGQLSEKAGQLYRACQGQLQEVRFQLSGVQKDIQGSVRRRLGREEQLLEFIAGELPGTVQRYLSVEAQALAHFESRLDLLDPALALKRGFTLTIQNGKIIGSAEAVDSDQPLETRFYDGVVHSLPQRKPPSV